jgi:hypothetical protein
MDLNRISARQQWLILIVIAILLATPYAIKRFWPAFEVLQSNQKKLNKNQDTIRNPNYPESPAEDEDDVHEDILSLQAKVDELNSQTIALQNRIPPLESQDVLLELSASARVNNINIIENVPYVVKRIESGDASKASDKSKKVQNQAPASRSAQRQSRRDARRQLGQTGVGTGNSASIIGAQPRQGELMYDVVNKLDEARPLQLMTLQGTYFGLMGFFEGIKIMPFQITLLNINIDTQVQVPSQTQKNIQGLPQLIRVSLIVAL